MTDWVYCPNGRGHLHELNPVSHPMRNISPLMRHFRKMSVGIRKSTTDELTKVWLIGSNETWFVPTNEIENLDVLSTGDENSYKICNICHYLLPVENFAINQRNSRQLVRRPSCKQCRTDIDKRTPKSQQAKRFEKNKPITGTPFKCPLCQKRSIVGVTAKIVADHNHHTGDIRDFICDSCNTGLGRFKNGKDCLRDALNYIEEREIRR